MRLKNITDVNEFLQVVNSCSGEVYLTSNKGDKYNLKSQLSQYIAMGALLGEHGDELEIWAENQGDQSKLIEFLSEHPGL